MARTFKKDDPFKPAKYYTTMKFQCKFPSKDNLFKSNSDDEKKLNSARSVLCFAYALPYVYSDLLTDI